MCNGQKHVYKQAVVYGDLQKVPSEIDSYIKLQSSPYVLSLAAGVSELCETISGFLIPFIEGAASYAELMHDHNDQLLYLVRKHF